jgi:hypothetical protein
VQPTYNVKTLAFRRHEISGRKYNWKREESIYRFEILPYARTREALGSVLGATSIYYEAVGMRGAFFFAPISQRCST